MYLGWTLEAVEAEDPTSALAEAVRAERADPREIGRALENFDRTAGLWEDAYRPANGIVGRPYPTHRKDKSMTDRELEQLRADLTTCAANDPHTWAKAGAAGNHRAWRGRPRDSSAASAGAEDGGAAVMRLRATDPRRQHGEREAAERQAGERAAEERAAREWENLLAEAEQYLLGERERIEAEARLSPEERNRRDVAELKHPPVMVRSPPRPRGFWVACEAVKAKWRREAEEREQREHLEVTA
jgi:hypothetical protein